MKDPAHGVDYLIDYYAVLDIPRDASPEAIKQGYREQARQYHPDNYERLAPQFRSQAQLRMNVINDAQTILLNRSKRQNYDAQLQKWQGPISKDGTPIRSLSHGGWDVSRLLGTSIESVSNSSPQLEMAAQMIGWNPAIHKVLQQQYAATDKPSADLKAAYDASLLQYGQYLQLKQAIQEEALGIQNAIPAAIPSNQLALEESVVAKRRKAVSNEVTDIMTAITRGEVKVVGPAAESMLKQAAANPAATVSRYRRQALQRFDAEAEVLLKTASEQADVARQRLALIDIQYQPPQQQLFDRVALCIRSGDKSLWQAWHLKGRQVDPDPSVTKAELQKLADTSAAQRMVDAGRNVITVTLPEGLTPEDVLEEALNLHFQAYLAAVR